MAAPGWFTPRALPPGSETNRPGRTGLAVRLAVVVAAAGLAAGFGLRSDGSSSPAGEVAAVPAPIVIETIDHTIDVTDPDLVAEVEDIHDGFETGRTRTVVDLMAALTSPTASAGAGITVSYDSGTPVPPDVQAVVQAAVGRWNDALATNPSGPINVAVIWSNLQPGLLGSAGPWGLYVHPSLPTNSLYPIALANTLLGTDLNGSFPELVVNLNASANWYVGTSGTPAPGQTDLFTVVLHELAHGLGFLGSGWLPDGSPNPILGYSSAYWSGTRYFVYDELVTHNSEPLLSTADPAGLLRSNNLFVDLSASYEAKLYAPPTWYNGSSYSHFDESAYPSGAPGALMTPSLGSQQVERELDGPVLGVMASMGWPLDARAITPSITGTSTTSGSAWIHWGLDMGQSGVAPDGFRVEAWRNGTILDATMALNGGYGSAHLTGLTSGSPYVLKVVPHAQGIDGVPATANVTVVGPPTAPALVRIGGSGLNRTVTWEAPPGTGITGYTVERSTDGTTWTPVGSTSSLSLAATFPTGIHQVRVRAANNYGAGQWGYSIPTGVSAGIARPVALDGQISRLYRAYFRRDPDQGGFSFWQAQRAAGVPLDGASNAFAASAEFAATYGNLSNEAFVDLVYQNVLGRTPDPGGRAYWLAQLAAGVSRGAVMTGFSESAEMVSATGTAAPVSRAESEIYRLYVAFFLRFPDPAGLQYWVGVRNGGASLESIAAAFAASTEFVYTYGSLPDDRFVALVYANVLARQPDGSGAGYWQGQLAGGLSRGSLMVGFSESQEFLIATGTLK